MMFRKILAVLAILASSLAVSQTTTTAPITAPQVLGCSNPAPAVPPQATVWLYSGCITPAFVPLTTASVVASVSATAPVWAHTYGGYASTDLIVTCPIGATVSGGSCTNNGADATVIVAKSSVPTATLPPPPISITASVQGSPNVVWQNVPVGTCIALTDGKHSMQACLPTN